MPSKLNRYFNIAGPCNAKKHYMIDGFKRGGNEILSLVDQEQYFVLHAARQSGKTTLLWEMVNHINAKGEYYALYCSLEAIYSFPDPEIGIPGIVKLIKNNLDFQGLPEGFAKNADYSDITGVLKSSLASYCRSLDKPLVIFFDEADCLSERTLITFLRQLRDGFVSRANVPFVHSISLIGMRNLRDFKAKIRPDSETLGSTSPFNIVTEALTLPTFTHNEITELYLQHTENTGQIFEQQAIDYIFEQTGGQPWLVNAVAREAVEKILKKDYSKPVTKDLAETAVQNLILARGTHFDSLMERLKEPRVRKVILPLLLGEENIDIQTDDFSHVKDLGLIKIDDKTKDIGPANPIYAEIMIRATNLNIQMKLSRNQTYQMPRYIKDGKIDINYLLKDFQVFWRENSEIIWDELNEEGLREYKEASPHLVLQAFLQRVINGGGQIIREMALGRKRVDLCVVYDNQKYPIELKILRNDKSVTDGISQTYEYMEKCSCAEGWLIIFDRDSQKSWDEKIYMRTENHKGKQITVVGA